MKSHHALLTSLGFLVVINLSCIGAITDAPSATTIILIRHAERLSSTNPVLDALQPLTEEGQARAQTLAEVLGEPGVDAIFCTDLLRNRQTVEPLASQLGLTPELVNPALYVNTVTAGQTVLNDILTDYPGKVVLFAGNRGSVAGTAGITERLYREMGGTGRAPDRYQDMYICIVPANGPAHFIKTIYGPESSLD